MTTLHQYAYITKLSLLNNNSNLLPRLHSHYTGQPVLAGIQLRMEQFAGAKFYWPHALADGN